jgi:hypothetical protein
VVLTLHPPLRPLSHNVNPRDGAQDITIQVSPLTGVASAFVRCRCGPAICYCAPERPPTPPFPHTHTHTHQSTQHQSPVGPCIPICLRQRGRKASGGEPLPVGSPDMQCKCARGGIASQDSKPQARQRPTADHAVHIKARNEQDVSVDASASLSSQ